MVRWRTKTMCILLAAVTPLTACTSGETQQEADSRNAFCAAAIFWVQSLQQDLDGVASDSFELMLDTATDEVHEALQDMLEIGPDSVRLSEQETYEDARSTVNDFIHDRCDLDISI